MLHKSRYPFRIDLQLFADGGSAAAGAGAADGGAATAEGNGAEKAEVAPPRYIGRRSKASQNPLAGVQYGKADPGDKANTDPAPDAGEQKTEETKKTVDPADRARAFEEMINGEYADLYGQRVKDTVEKRLKSTKETVEKMEALRPVLEILGKKYGIDPTDVKAIAKAVDLDDSYLEEESMETGTPTEQLRKIRNVTRENTALKEAERVREAREQSEKLYQRWTKEAEAAKAVYPTFNLAKEIENPTFKSLLKSNIDVKTAYEVVHHDDLVPAAMSAAARNAEQRVADSVMANGMRPHENGNRSSSTAIRRTDVGSYTKADRAEIARRAARGEKIRL